ncbi:hypothetical protein KKD19_06660 [Patescibacteria group bacterium]|nr:hypothetical protein [Patescibacteria group bacterium]MBU4512884.1 hypothetical protein [Patescibacteria group bacterium]
MPEKIESHNLDPAQKETTKLPEKIESEEAKDYDETKKNEPIKKNEVHQKDSIDIYDKNLDEEIKTLETSKREIESKLESLSTIKRDLNERWKNLMGGLTGELDDFGEYKVLDKLKLDEFKKNPIKKESMVILKKLKRQNRNEREILSDKRRDLIQEDMAIIQTKKTFVEAETKCPTIETEKDREKIEQIKDKIIDIKEYQGLVHRTQLSNLEPILLEGFTQKTLEKIKWGCSGGYKKRYHEFGDHLSLTLFIKPFCSFLKEGGSQHWIAGPAMLFFDYNKLKNVRYHMESGGLFRGDNLKNGIDDAIEKQKKYKGPKKYQEYREEYFGTNELHIDKKDEILLKDAIQGIVLWPGGAQMLSRGGPEKTKKRPGNVFYMSDQELERRSKMIKEPISLSRKQIYEIATNRLSRIFHQPDAHLVPVYDNYGNLLWPEKIPYEEIQKIAENNMENQSKNP